MHQSLDAGKFRFDPTVTPGKKKSDSDSSDSDETEESESEESHLAFFVLLILYACIFVYVCFIISLSRSVERTNVMKGSDGNDKNIARACVCHR